MGYNLSYESLLFVRFIVPLAIKQAITV